MAAADVADGEAIVISHPGIGVDSLSRQTVRDLYLGKSVQLANGTRVELIDLPAGHPVREDFYVNIIGRDPGQMRAYWAKRIFTGKGRPPETLHDERAVVRWVAEESGRIAYVGAGAVDDSVRILYKQQHND